MNSNKATSAALDLVNVTPSSFDNNLNENSCENNENSCENN